MERIDYIIIDVSLVQNIITSDILPAFASDHALPFIHIKLDKSKPGPGYWKFNNALLDDDTFVQNVVKEMTTVLSDASVDIFDRWELMKFTVKQCALKRSIEISKSQKNKLEVLNKKLPMLNQKETL